MTLRDRVLDALAEGEKEAKERGAFFENWWEYFDMDYNPFEDRELDPIENERDEALFVDFGSVMTELGRLIGRSKHAQGLHKVAVVGPEGIGKKSIARTLYSIVGDSAGKGLVFDVTAGQPVYPRVRTKTRQLPQDEDLSFVILDNPSTQEKTLSYFSGYDNRRMLVIGFWLPEILPDHFEHHLRIDLDSLEKRETHNLIKRRIASAGAKEDLFPSSVLDSIHVYSRGIPMLALVLAREALVSAYQRRKPVPDIDDVCDAARAHGMTSDIQSLTENDLQVLRLIFQLRSVTPPALAEKLDISRVMAWKYLDKYYEMKILNRNKKGKAYQYEAARTGRALVGLELLARRSSTRN